MSQACEACAQAKLKCREQKPCQRCVTKGIRCTYNESEHRGVESWRAGSSIDDSLLQGSITEEPNDCSEMDDLPVGNDVADQWVSANSQPASGNIDATGIERMK